MENKENKLFCVEFGKLDKPGWFSMSSDDIFVHVVAETFSEAVKKAIKFITENPPNKVVEKDGSLGSTEVRPIKSIKLICESVIM